MQQEYYSSSLHLMAMSKLTGSPEIWSTLFIHGVCMLRECIIW